MTIDYQQSLLSFLVQSSEGIKYVDDLSEELFDLVEHSACLQILKKYKKQYGLLPGKLAAIQFAEEQIKNTPNISEQLAKDIREVVEDIFFPLSDGDKVNIQDTIILEVQSKYIEDSYMDFAAGKLSPTQVLMKMDKLGSLVKSTSEVNTHASAGFIVAERDKHYEEQVEGNPIFLHDMNTMTAARGFYSPQLIVFMSGPKAYKTGMLIKTAVEYARGGKKVYYADFENGARSIRNRIKQCIMECTLDELFNEIDLEELNETLYRFGHMMGGDVYVDEFPANISSIKDVKSRLAYLQEEYDWKPDIIIYDSIDHLTTSNTADRSRDVRIKIQLVYHEAINLNRELKTFCFVPSQVNREAVSKKVFDMKDISEDFGKIFNAHSIWAICASPDELEQGIRRIIPIAQREGVGYKGRNFCLVKIDDERMLIQEVDKEAYLADIKDE